MFCCCDDSTKGEKVKIERKASRLALCKPLEELIERALEFEGDKEIATRLGVMVANAEEALSLLEQLTKAPPGAVWPVNVRRAVELLRVKDTGTEVPDGAPTIPEALLENLGSVVREYIREGAPLRMIAAMLIKWLASAGRCTHPLMEKEDEATAAALRLLLQHLERDQRERGEAALAAFENMKKREE